MTKKLARAAAVLAAFGLASCAPPPPPAAPPSPPMMSVAPKVGLALGGGGARGLAEIGVLRVLEQEKIPIDIVVGTSVGSLVGALYADTGRVLDAEFHAVTVTEEDLFDYKALSIFSGGFVKGERLEAFLTTHLKHKTLEGFRVPFAAVAVNLRTGVAVAFDKGSAAKAVHASCAIPGVFVPVEISGTAYVDGGVTDPVPVDFARRKGAEVVVAVSVPYSIPSVTPRTPIEVVYHAVAIMSSEIGRRQAKDADVAIEPAVGDVRYDDFSQKKRLIEAGEAAGQAAIPAIRAAIRAKTRNVLAGALQPR